MNFFALLKQALSICSTQRGSYLIPACFLLLCSSIFPFGLNTDPLNLLHLAPGIIWVCTLISCLSSVQTLFKDDYTDGSLEFYKASGVPLSYWILSRVVAFWFFNTIALLGSSWLVCVFYHVPTTHIPLTILPLVIGLASLSLLGGMASAITVSTATTSALVSLLALPLALPILIFGSQASLNAVLGENNTTELEVLTVLLLIYIPVSISLATIALNSALEER